MELINKKAEYTIKMNGEELSILLVALEDGRSLRSKFAREFEAKAKEAHTDAGSADLAGIAESHRERSTDYERAYVVLRKMQNAEI